MNVISRRELRITLPEQVSHFSLSTKPDRGNLEARAQLDESDDGVAADRRLLRIDHLDGSGS